MDAMDFTMDEAQANHHPPSNSHRHQCQPSQPPSNSTSFSPHTRDNQHYDPVYDSGAWYQANNAPTRAPYPAPDNIHWGGNSFLPAPSWQGQGLGDGQHSGGQDPTTFRQSRFMGVPWNEMRGFDPSPFAFNPYTSPLNNGSSESASNGPTAAPAVTSSNPQAPSTYGQEARSVRMSFLSPFERAPSSSKSSHERNPSRVSCSRCLDRLPTFWILGHRC
jgi:hypothetical protein